MCWRSLIAFKIKYVRVFSFQKKFVVPIKKIFIINIVSIATYIGY